MPGLWYAINCKDIFAYRTLVQVSQIALACANFCRQGPIRDELWPITSEHWSNQWEAELGDVIRGRSQSPELVSLRVYQPGSIHRLQYGNVKGAGKYKLTLLFIHLISSTSSFVRDLFPLSILFYPLNVIQKTCPYSSLLLFQYLAFLELNKLL